MGQHTLTGGCSVAAESKAEFRAGLPATAAEAVPVVVAGAQHHRNIPSYAISDEPNRGL